MTREEIKDLMSKVNEKTNGEYKEQIENFAECLWKLQIEKNTLIKNREYEKVSKVRTLEKELLQKIYDIIK